MSGEVDAGEVATLGPADARAVRLGARKGRLPLAVLVVRDGAGRPHAYLNLCRHLPIPIDAGSGQYVDERTGHLLCGTHGALYRREDGLCVEGPCRGLALHELPLTERDGRFYVAVDEAALPES